MFDISIIIPTTGSSFNDCLKPCIESLIKYTDFSHLDTQVVIVSNGSDREVNEYLQNLYKTYNSFINVSCLDTQIGFPKAINEGLRYCLGKYIVILNDDVEFLPQNTNTWMNLLYRPFFQDPMMGITGCHSLTCPVTKEEFIVFFCAMIKREVFSAVGLLNEAFTPGYGEDIDFCIRAKKVGYNIRNVNTNVRYPNGKNYVIGDFPINHKGEMTVHKLENWEDVKKRNNNLLKKFYTDNDKKKVISLSKLMKEKEITVNDNILISRIDSKDVTVGITTKDRYYTTLPLTLQSVINQTIKPKKILLFDDSENEINLENDPTYKSLFHIMKLKNIEYEVLKGYKKGQIHNHQHCLEIASTEFIWRVDDDNVPEFNVLESLLDEIKKDENIGAIGGLILNATGSNKILPSFVTGKIEDILFGLNIQWFIHKDTSLIEVDHLYGTFLYRKKAGFPHGYCLDLSKVGFREETIFTYEMKRHGWKLLVHPNVITWHIDTESGGIRDFDISLRNHDEVLFLQKLNEWGVKAKYLKFYVLYNGIGDHFMFKMLLPKIKEKYKNTHKIILFCCHPKVFSDVKDDNIQIAEIGDAIGVFGSSCIKENCVYTWCKKNGWDGNFLDAMKVFYLGENPYEENNNQSLLK